MAERYFVSQQGRWQEDELEEAVQITAQLEHRRLRSTGDTCGRPTFSTGDASAVSRGYRCHCGQRGRIEGMGLEGEKAYCKV
jgi:hypothetical protein